MFQGLKHVFHKGGQNLLKIPGSQPPRETHRQSVVMVEGAPRRVRMSDISSERSSQLDVQRSTLGVGGTSSRRSTAVVAAALAPGMMEARPLPKRNRQAAPEVSRQALELAMMGEGADVRYDGTVSLATTITTPAEIMCCRFNNSGQYLAVGMMSGDTSVYSTDATGAHVTLLQDADTVRRGMPVTCAKFVPVPEGKLSAVLITTYGDGLVKFWQFMTGDCLQTLDVEEQVLALSFDCLGKYFQIAGEDGAVRVFDVATTKQAGWLRASSNHALNDGHRSRVFALAPHPHTPHELLSAGWDNTVLFWDMRHPHATRRVYGPHICGEGLSIEPQTSQILTASWRRRQALQLWDYGSGELVTDLQPDTFDSMQTCAQFMGRDYIATAGGFANIVRMIDCRTLLSCGMIRNLPQSVRCQDVAMRTEGQFPRIAACHGSDVLLIDTWH